MFRPWGRLIALIWILGTAAIAAEGPIREKSKTFSPEAAIRRALDRPISLHFDKKPLDEIARELERRLDIEVGLDSKALEDVGIGSDQPATIDVKNISLAAALAIMLRPLDLVWCVQDEMLLITTPEEAEECLETRFYDVTDLLSTCYYVDGERVYHDAGYSSDFDSLTDIITSCVAPTTWGPGNSGIPGGLAGRNQFLVIPQTEDVHREIEELLGALRQAQHDKPECENPLLEPAKTIRNRDDAVRRALDRKITFDIPGRPKDSPSFQKPLTEVVQLLAKAGNINILIDQWALDDIGMGPQQPIRVFPMRGTLRACLERVCPEELCWAVHDEVLWITTKEEEETAWFTRVYDIWDFPPEPCKPTDSDRQYGGGMMGMGMTPDGFIDLEFSCPEDELTAAITKIIPNSRDHFVRYQGPSINVLIVSGRWVFHERIQTFLAALRKARRKAVEKAKPKGGNP